MRGSIRGQSFAQFADYADSHGPRGHGDGPRADPGEAECCVNCQHEERCLIDYNPDPPLRRCALEEYLYARDKCPPGYLTARQVAERSGLHYSSVVELCNQGRYPGARKQGRTWVIPAGAISRAP